jgi:hypothetical protein
VLKRISPLNSHSVDGGTIYDFGVNVAGVCELTLPESASPFRVELHYAEQVCLFLFLDLLSYDCSYGRTVR